MADKKDMLLYWGSGSPPCWRAMIVLAEKGKWKDGVTEKQLQFSEGEHKKSDVLELNPRGQLPTFKDKDLVVNESGAICLYLEEKYCEGTRLLPTDVNAKAGVYQRMFEVSNVISNINEPLRYRRSTKREDWDSDQTEAALKKAREELDRWNTILCNKKYLCGDDFTLADAFFYPYLALMVRNGATLSGYPELKRYYNLVTERPSVKATWPPHWIGSKGPDFLNDL